ncbi:MAG: nuclear transport factor 2 family protein [Acidimicrobiales bacterium]|nr:nuclear transport factor 2 family protein [Acidimicrobiales bacterium]MDG1878087.1 nuclear transport factor 2 family protein [Acidimicrobiales bacterium]
MALPDVAHRFLDALNAGDVEAARACYHPDAEVWHDFDGVTQTVDENMHLMAVMGNRASRREYVIRRLEPIEGGYLQQHTLEITTLAGRDLRAEAVAIVQVGADGLISRLDEWINPAPLAPLFE